MSMSEPRHAESSGAAEEEHRFHHYTGNRIPWYVRSVWLLFWIFAVCYTLLYLFPALRFELRSPP